MDARFALPLLLIACGSDPSEPPPVADASGPDAEAVDAAAALDSAVEADVAKPSVDAGASGSTYLGCPVFGPHGWFDTDVSGVAADPQSAAYIKATVDAGDKGGFNVWLPPDERINVATSATPLLTVHPKVSYHSFPFQVPWDASFYIEPASDAHAMVVDTSTCRLYEFWNASYANGTFSAYSGASWDMTKPFDPKEYDQGSTASGIPLTAIMVKPEELKAGSILHSLGWGAVASGSKSTVGSSFVAPAHSSGGLAYGGPAGETPMPYGSHIRLKAGFDDSAFPAGAKAVTTALKHFGAYLYDTGCCDEIPFTDDASGSISALWSSADGAAISGLRITDFDVVPPSAL